MIAPAGIIIAWPSSAASIPAGWSRVAALNGRYLRGAASPGATGGSANHNHGFASHSHLIDPDAPLHGHDISGTSDAASLTVGSASLNAQPASSHAHTSGNMSAQTVICATEVLTSSDAANDPSYLSVIWIQSDGSSGIPTGAIAWSATVPSGWSAQAPSRFLKGAAAGADGGSLAGSDSHSHAIADHTHAAPHDDNHTSLSSLWDPGGNAHGVSYYGEHVAVYYIGGHHHTWTWIPSTATTTTSSSTASSITALPPYLHLYAIRNDTGAPDLSPGIIAAWIGSPASIPAGWRICNGASGTYDLTGKIIRAASAPGDIGTTGGSASNHAHTFTHAAHDYPHTETTSTSGVADNGVTTDQNSGAAMAWLHSHGPGSLAASDASPIPHFLPASTTSASTDNIPPYYDVVFIMYWPEHLTAANNIYGQRFRSFEGAGGIAFERQDIRGGDWSALISPSALAGYKAPDLECLPDGRLHIACLSSAGAMAHAYSSDDGESWSLI